MPPYQECNGNCWLLSTLLCLMSVSVKMLLSKTPSEIQDLQIMSVLSCTQWHICMFLLRNATILTTIFDKFISIISVNLMNSFYKPFLCVAFYKSWSSPPLPTHTPVLSMWRSRSINMVHWVCINKHQKILFSDNSASFLFHWSSKAICN